MDIHADQQKRNPNKKVRLPLVGAVVVVVAGAALALTGQASAAVDSYSPSRPTSIHQDDTAVLNPDGTVTVRVTTVCPSGEFNHLVVNMSERVGDLVVAGQGWEGMRCDGNRQSFAVNVRPWNGTFVEGTAWSEPMLPFANGEREITVVR